MTRQAGSLTSQWKEGARSECCPCVYYVCVPRFAGHEFFYGFLLIKHQLLVSISKSAQPEKAAFLFGALRFPEKLVGLTPVCRGTAAPELAIETCVYNVRDGRKPQMPRPGTFCIAGAAGYLE